MIWTYNFFNIREWPSSVWSRKLLYWTPRVLSGVQLWRSVALMLFQVDMGEMRIQRFFGSWIFQNFSSNIACLLKNAVCRGILRVTWFARRCHFAQKRWRSHTSTVHLSNDMTETLECWGNSFEQYSQKLPTAHHLSLFLFFGGCFVHAGLGCVRVSRFTFMASSQNPGVVEARNMGWMLFAFGAP